MFGALTVRTVGLGLHCLLRQALSVKLGGGLCGSFCAMQDSHYLPLATCLFLGAASL